MTSTIDPYDSGSIEFMPGNFVAQPMSHGGEQLVRVVSCRSGDQLSRDGRFNTRLHDDDKINCAAAGQTSSQPHFSKIAGT